MDTVLKELSEPFYSYHGTKALDHFAQLKHEIKASGDVLASPIRSTQSTVYGTRCMPMSMPSQPSLG